MATSAIKTYSIPRAPVPAASAAAHRSKFRALVAWFFAPPELPTYPPIDDSQEPPAARAARLRRIQTRVDDLLTPAYPYYHPW